MNNLLTAIIIAKDILDSNPELISVIHLDRHFLGKEKFDINHKTSKHVNVSNMYRIVKKAIRIKEKSTTSKEIKILKHSLSPPNGSKMAGIVMKETENKYSIHIEEHETYCTQRLATCKELVQVMVDNLYFDNTDKQPVDASSQIMEAQKELIQRFYSTTHHPELLDEITSSEMFAQAITLEILIPYSLREEIATLHRVKNMSLEEISERLFIPKETLEEYMNSYFDMTTPIYNQL